jgi:type IV secretion system protein VirB9
MILFSKQRFSLKRVFLKRGMFLFVVLPALIAGCKTVDVTPPLETARDKTVGIEPPPPTAEELAVEDLTANFDFAPQVVFVERPVYVPSQETGAEASNAKNPPAGLDSVRQSTEDGTIKPESYSHAARVYDFHRDQVFEVYTQVLRTTDIYLEQNETVVETPFISDSERWIVGAGVSGQEGSAVQHIYIKPKEAGLHASMIINTDRRVYHIILRSYRDVYMPMVRFRYPAPNEGFPLKFRPSQTTNRSDTGITTRKQADFTEDMEYVDPRFLSFDYAIRFSAFRRPKWIPRLVYDDGKKTYLVFDEQVLQMEMPGIFENKTDIVNYRVNRELIIIDKLVEKITVKYKKDAIVIEKKTAKKRS